MATIFTKIIDGEIPGTFVYEDEQCVAFLDVSPLTAGHTMVVPRAEISEWTDLDEELLDHLMNVAHRIGRAQKSAFDCERIGLMIVGYEVPHVHIHVWPTTSMADFDISDRVPMQDAATLAEPAEKIRQALAQQS
ncbi:HIT family protein [Brevibacterium casei]